MSRFNIEPIVSFLNTFDFKQLRQPNNMDACQEFFDTIMPFLKGLNVHRLQGPECEELQQVFTVLIDKFDLSEREFFGWRYDHDVELHEMGRNEYLELNGVTSANFLSRCKIIFVGADESNQLGLESFLAFENGINRLIALLNPLVAHNMLLPRQLFPIAPPQSPPYNGNNIGYVNRSLFPR